MGDVNQLNLLKKLIPTFKGKILEIGSKAENSVPPYRKLYPQNPYVGLDMEPGTNVDVVLDLTEGIGELEEESFDLIICTSVLEHVKYPWLMAENITKLSRPGGFLYMSVPWIWRYHAYPDDYYRYSPSGIMALFPEYNWKGWYVSTRKIGEIFSISKLPGFDTALKLQPMMINAVGRKNG